MTLKVSSPQKDDEVIEAQREQGGNDSDVVDGLVAQLVEEKKRLTQRRTLKIPVRLLR